MGYPQKLLANGETIQFELRPAWKTLLWPIFWLIVIVGLFGFLYGRIRSWFDGPTGDFIVWGLVFVALVALGILVVRPFLFWLTTQYVFTNHRIIIRTGIIARSGRDMPLSKVNDVSFSHSVWERLLNCGTLIVQSAAENGGLVIENIPKVEEVQREVYRLHDEDDAWRRARNSGIDPSPPTVES